MGLPDLLLAWYGDDFTGSTDVLEVLALHDLPSVLFLRPPDAGLLASFPGMRAIGLAGEARSTPVDWMDRRLGPTIGSLGSLGPRLVHYKVCSTFDSAPGTGSIGRAMEIGRSTLGVSVPVPVVVGAPALRRYSAFGNLFATVGDETIRLDRHPTMSRHPVTPMLEADLRRHLALQTRLRVELFDLLALWSDDYRLAFRRALAEGPDAILFDVADRTSLERVGELIWEEMGAARFAVASSGLEYALVAYWQSVRLLDAPADPPCARSVDRLAVVSGSCSPATAAQVEHAERLGWHCIEASPARLANAATRATETERLEQSARRALAAARSVVIHTSRGPGDPRSAEYETWLRDASGAARHDTNAAIGTALGEMLRALVEREGIERAIVAGGDTSSAAGAALGLDALTLIAPTAPGSPLCRAHSANRQLDGLSIVFKGGQVGGADYFEAVRQGRSLDESKRY
jgi:uncharacterized protein YgbK (DUF1537 family)